jgi:tRNA (guanine-N7-)-methyltransferase
MGRKNKLQKFQDLKAYPNVIENPEYESNQLFINDDVEIDLSENWAQIHFGNDKPVTLELACGRGEYTLQLGRHFPEKNFIGIDVKGARIWKGATIALDENLTNVAFLRSRIEKLGIYFREGDISEIWITFPDPFLNPTESKHRLTSPHFLDIYKQILIPGGIINLKTDDDLLYEYTLKVVEADPGITLLYAENDIYSRPLIDPTLEFKTYYEGLHLAEGKKIKYVKFQLKD